MQELNVSAGWGCSAFPVWVEMPCKPADPGEARGCCRVLVQCYSIPTPPAPHGFLPSHSDQGFCLAAPAKGTGLRAALLKRLQPSPCFLSTESSFSCRKLLVLLLVKKDDNGDRQARSACPTQTTMLQAPWQPVQGGDEASSCATPSSSVQM